MKRFVGLFVAALLGVGLMAASASADSSGITYQVNPLMEPSGVTNPGSLTNPYCSTRNGVQTLVCYTPNDIKTAYNYPSGLTGAGQTIIIVDAYGSPTVQQDLAAFDSVFGLPAPPSFQVVCPDGCPTFSPNHHDPTGWAEETSLDVQWAHAVAPGANIVLAVAPAPAGDAINSVEAKIFGNPAYKGAIVSQSFGSFEWQIHGGGNNLQLQQAHKNYQLAQQNGMTVLASAGDWGSSNLNPSIANGSYPASDPLVTGIGGTQGNPYYNGRAGSGGLALPSCAANTPCSVGLASIKCTTNVSPGPTTSTTAICPTVGYGGEEVWNEPFLPAATGGAPSLVFSRPSFQAGDGTGNAMRTTPDVSYNAAVSGGVLVALSIPGIPAGFYIFGGTSAGSPQMAGVLALANQARGLAGKGNLGYLNPRLYQIAESSAYSSDFHDITVGNDEYPGLSAPSFSAGPGYDIASGWGTPNVANLINSLASS